MSASAGINPDPKNRIPIPKSTEGDGASPKTASEILQGVSRISLNSQNSEGSINENKTDLSAIRIQPLPPSSLYARTGYSDTDRDLDASKEQIPKGDILDVDADIDFEKALAQLPEGVDPDVELLNDHGTLKQNQVEKQAIQEEERKRELRQREVDELQQASGSIQDQNELDSDYQDSSDMPQQRNPQSLIRSGLEGYNKARTTGSNFSSSLQGGVKNMANTALQNSEIGQKASEVVKKAQQAKKVVAGAKNTAAVIRGAIAALNPGTVTVIVVILIVMFVFTTLVVIIDTFKRSEEVGGGADKFIFTGLASPDSCTRSAAEATLGVAARSAAIKTGIDYVTFDKNNNFTTQGRQSLNQYAKYAALTVQATSNLMRYGSAQDKSIENPTENSLNPYRDASNPEGSGIKINKDLGELIQQYLTSTSQSNPTDEDSNQVIENIMGYDPDTATVKIEGAGLVLQPGASITTYGAPQIQYFDTNTLQNLSGGPAGNRQVVGGPLGVRSATDTSKFTMGPTATRQTSLHESFGIDTQDFAPQPPVPPAQNYSLGYKFDDKGQPYREVPPPVLRAYIYYIDNKGTDDTADDVPYIFVSGVRRDLTSWETNKLLNGYSFDANGRLFITLKDGRTLFVDNKGTDDESDDTYTVVENGSEQALSREQGAQLASSTIVSSPPPLTGSAQNRLTDGTLVSFNSFSVGVNARITFLSFRIPIISDIIEGVINSVLNNLNFTIASKPVLSSGYYRAANIGSFGSTLLNRFDANLDHPFQNYTKHTAINDANEVVNSLYEGYLSKPIAQNTGYKLEKDTKIDIDIDKDKPASDAASATQKALDENPDIQAMKAARAKAEGSLTGSSNPAIADYWQSQTGPYAIRDAMKNITDSFLRAGNSTRSVAGLNVSLTLNIAVNVFPAPPFVSVLIGVPTISGLYAKKTISNAPNGREYLDLYNRVAIAVLRASADPKWSSTQLEAPTFNTGIFADGTGIADGVKDWVNKCATKQYDVVDIQAVSSAFTQTNGLNSCKLYEKMDDYKYYNQYLSGTNIERNGKKVVVNQLTNVDDPEYLTVEEKEKLKNLGIEDRRSYFESIIMSEARAQGIDPTDGEHDELDRSKMAFLLASAAYSSNANDLPNTQADFVKFSEINPVNLPELGDVFSSVTSGNIGGAVDSILTPLGTSLANGISGANESDIALSLLETTAGVNETYGPLGKGVTDIAYSALTSVVQKLTSTLKNFGDVRVDLQTIIKKLYKTRVTGNITSGFFDDDTIGYVFDPDKNGAMYYGRGFLPGVTRGRGIYKQLEESLGKNLVSNNLTGAPGDPNLVRQDPSTMAQVLVSGMKQGIFTGYRLEDFFSNTRIDPINAQSIFEPNFVFVSEGLKPDVLETGVSSENPERTQEQTILDNAFMTRYKYYYKKLGSVDEKFYNAARQVCNTAPDGKIFKDNSAANACVAEGFNYLNTSDEKLKYQSYGFTIKANPGTSIYPLYGGKILYSNFATKPPPSAKGDDSTPKISEQDIIQRRQKNDPASGNQISIVSNVDGKMYVIRYTNLDGSKAPPIGLQPGTSVNKDDIIGYVGNSGSQFTSSSPAQVRVEIVQYYGAGLEQKIENIFTAVKQTGELKNPVFHIKTKISSQEADAMSLCSSDKPELYQSLNQSPNTKLPKGVTVPGVNIPFDTWLILR